jgi:prepilin-type N-terminal cleavage/methylation domain-containing protein
MESRNKGFTLIEVMIAASVMAIVLGGISVALIMSQRTVKNISDNMLLVQAERDLKRQLKRDINSAKDYNINGSGTELELLNSSNDVIAYYQFDTVQKKIDYSREESGSLKSKSPYPRQDCEIDNVRFEFITATNSIRFEAEFLKETSSKKENNILNRDLETVIKMRGMY